MAYTFKNTEINNEKASNFETKSLLYLIGKRSDSKEIEYVTFDCFNDVSGINKKFNQIWDVQSKNEKSINPKKIGKYFYTLFDNYISSITLSFKEFIFFAPIINYEYKIDVNLNTYSLVNIKFETLTRIKNGLIEEVIRVKGDAIDYKLEIDEFLKIVTIVEDCYSENEYIKAITKFKKTELKTDEFYKSIFVDLRNIQTNKKNSCIENNTIIDISEVLVFQRHLSVKDIDLLVISRIIGCDVFNYVSIPLYFSPVIDKLSFEDKKDVLLDCNSNLSRAFFNKNNNKGFWLICEKIISYFSNNDNRDVETVYCEIFKPNSVRISFLTDITIKYLISIIIEGLEW